MAQPNGEALTLGLSADPDFDGWKKVRSPSRRKAENGVNKMGVSGVWSFPKMLSLFLLNLALLLTVISNSTLPAHAAVATSGDGRFRSDIDWFVWGNQGEVFDPGKTYTRTNTRALGGRQMVTTCQLSQIVGRGGLRASKSGSYSGDALDNLYNVGGTGSRNTLVNGLSNFRIGQLVTFTVSCSVTLDGEPVSYEGIVVADAESTNHNVPNAEYLEVRAKDSQGRLVRDWQLLDRFRRNGCPSSVRYLSMSEDFTRISSTGSECGTPGGPITVTLLENARSIDARVKGQGLSTLAIGLMIPPFDFGDAPASYGEATAANPRAWVGGKIEPGTDAWDPSTGLANVRPRGPRLGRQRDHESGYVPSANADSDDRDGSPNDEDGWVNPPQFNRIAARVGERVELTIACTGPGFVAGWIDWNSNGRFDDTERSEPVRCAGAFDTQVNLGWTVPENAVDSDSRVVTSYMRLRVASAQAEVASPTALTNDGEVEDHKIELLISHLATVTASKNWLINEQSKTSKEVSDLGITAHPVVRAAGESVVSQWDVTSKQLLSGEEIQVSETITGPGKRSSCRMKSRRITQVNGAATNYSLDRGPRTLKVATGDNRLEITNSVTCDSVLILEVQVRNGPAHIREWSLSAQAVGSARPQVGGNGLVYAKVVADTPYRIAVTGGDPRYVQKESWACQRFTLDDHIIGPMALSGTDEVSVPAGWRVRCSVVYETASLVLLNKVTNSHGGTLTASDWTLRAVPKAPVNGLTDSSVVGSEQVSDPTTLSVRPDHSYEVSPEAGKGGYLQTGFQLYTCAVETREIEHGNARCWTDANPSSVAVPAGRTAIYRFVHVDTPRLRLPLTGSTLTVMAALFAAAVTALLAIAWRVSRQAPSHPQNAISDVSSSPMEER